MLSRIARSALVCVRSASSASSSLLLRTPTTLRVAHISSATRPNKTFKHQATLPLLPIPKLEDTCANYLRLLSPLVSSKDLEDTKEIVKWFSGTEGQQLHNKLLALAEESQTSWLEGFWDTMYLEDRSPVPINVNPFFIFSDATVSEGNPQIKRATSVIHSMMKFLRLYRRREMEPDFEGTTPLCMSQYGKLLGTARIPHVGRDALVTNHHAKHMIVLRNKQSFVVQLLDKNNNIIKPAELESKLAHIVKQADAAASGTVDEASAAGGVGLLTTLDRNTWAVQRQALASSNEALLEQVDSALLVLCLDSAEQATLLDSARNMLHADGRNRWFDKFQVIVEPSGRVGINMEHAPADGHSALRLATDVYYDLNGTRPMPLDEHEPPSSLPDVSQLQWRVTPDTVRAIGAADSSFQHLVASTDTSVLELPRFGRDAIKALGLAPDAFVQMSYQLANFRLTGKLVSTYESANTKQFLHGRTETIRSASPEAAAFCRAFGSQTPDNVRALLKLATEAHSKHSLECKNGLGVDRHLFGLRMLAKHQQQRIAGYNIPAIFLDPSYTTFTSNLLSTSNCGGDAMQLFGFGPVHPKGFGLGYMIKPSTLQITVTSFAKGQSAVMADAITAALDDMAALPR